MFAHGWNTTSNSTLHLQALATNPDSTNSGVSVNSWTYLGWQNPNSPYTLGAIASSSALAANQAGRVYGIVAGNPGPEIVEWAYDDSGTYTKTGTATTSPL